MTSLQLRKIGAKYSEAKETPSVIQSPSASAQAPQTQGFLWGDGDMFEFEQYLNPLQEGDVVYFFNPYDPEVFGYGTVTGLEQDGSANMYWGVAAFTGNIPDTWAQYRVLPPAEGYKYSKLGYVYDWDGADKYVETDDGSGFVVGDIVNFKTYDEGIEGQLTVSQVQLLWADGYSLGWRLQFAEENNIIESDLLYGGQANAANFLNGLRER